MLIFYLYLKQKFNFILNLLYDLLYFLKIYNFTYKINKNYNKEN